MPGELAQILVETQGSHCKVFLDKNPELTQVCLNSKDLTTGGLFVALPGRQSDGRAFIQDATDRGARLVLAEKNNRLPALHNLFWVKNLTQWLPEIAANFYNAPSSQLNLVGVTGTNGKTSVTYMLAQVLGRDDAGCLGTLGVGAWDQLQPSRNTTADIFSIHANLAQMVDNGIKTACMEVSSHAIDQGRIRGLTFHSALFTNLSHDHLDYHGDLESYGRVKGSLFQSYSVQNPVFNLSDPYVRETCEAVIRRNANVWGYHLGPEADPLLPEDRQVWLESVVHQDAHSMQLNIRIQTRLQRLKIPLVGGFNIENILAVITLLLTLESADSETLARLESIIPPPGRMQQLVKTGCPRVVIDYAHTPDALDKALNSIRPLCQGELWCVFGCGGDRDLEKRPLMGAVAATHADRVLLTSDNPRTEDPDCIIQDVLAGISHAQRAQIQVEPDRKQAITSALTQARPTDWILISGKGHEGYQEIYGVRTAFRDQGVVESVWSRLSDAGRGIDLC